MCRISRHPAPTNWLPPHMLQLFVARPHLILIPCPCSPTQELRGLGVANLLGCCFNCYTTTGSFSRTSVMDMVGARTQLAGIFTGTPSALPLCTPSDSSPRV